MFRANSLSISASETGAAKSMLFMENYFKFLALKKNLEGSRSVLSKRTLNTIWPIRNQYREDMSTEQALWVNYSNQPKFRNLKFEIASERWRKQT